MSNEGKLIVIEGLDGCFKETQSNMLHHCLRQKFPDKEILLQSFPRYGEHSGIICYELLHGKYGIIDNLPIPLVNDMYAIDRACAWYGGMKEKYENGAIFVIDRYTYSNCIYQLARIMSKEDMDMTAIRQFVMEIITREFLIYKIKRPDITIHLDMEFGCMMNVLSEKKNRDMNELDAEYMMKVYNASNIFYHIMQEDTTIHHVKCSDESNNPRTREDIHSDIIKIVETVI